MRDALKVPEKVERDWHVVKSRGRSSGQSQIFELRHRRDARLAVLKVPKLKDETDRLRFKREVQILRTIDHRNIVRLLDSNVETEPYYYITPFGRPLNQWWDVERPGAVDEAYRIIRSLLEGLALFHGLGGVHRDIKPANVVMLAAANEPDCPVLIDFGVAHISGDDHLTRPEHPVGNIFATPPGSPYGAYDDPPAAWDCFGIAWLWAWMLAKDQPKHGRYHWAYHRFIDFDRIPIVRAVMAICSTESLCPVNASEMIKTLDNVWVNRHKSTGPGNANQTKEADYLAAAEINARRHAAELTKRAAEVEPMEAAAAFVTPLIAELSDRIKNVFIKASKFNPAIAPTFLDLSEGDFGMAMQRFATNQGGVAGVLELVRCVCGIDPPQPFWITVHVFVDNFSRFLPFGVAFQLHHPILFNSNADKARMEYLNWDGSGLLWMGRERVVTIEDVEEMIHEWLTERHLWEI